MGESAAGTVGSGSTQGVELNNKIFGLGTAMSSRNERRRAKRAERRIAARASAATMLAEEDRHRLSLDELLTKSLAIGRHLELDTQIRAVAEKATGLVDDFKRAIFDVDELLERLTLRGLEQLFETPPSPTDREPRDVMAFKASTRFRDAEAALEEMGLQYASFAQLLLERADLRLGGITRAELENELEGLARRADFLEAGVIAKRSLVDEILASSGKESA